MKWLTGLKFRRFSLGNRLFLVTGIALIPGLLVLAYNETVLRHSRAAEVHAMALRTGQLAALEINRVLIGIEGILNAIAHVPAVLDFTRSECDGYLVALKSDLPQVTSIAVLDLQGNLRCSSTAHSTSDGYEHSAFFHDVMSLGTFAVGDYTVGRPSGKVLLPLGLPIEDREGRIRGVVATGIDLAWLGARVRDRSFSEDRALVIADRKGVIIAREPFSERFVGTRIPAPFDKLINAETPGSLEVMSQDGAVRIIGYVPARQSGLYVSAGLSKDVAFAAIDQATGRGVLIAIAGAVLAFFTAWLLGRGLVRGPINRILTTIEVWRRGDVAARTGMKMGTGEIAEIGAAIDQSMDELVAARIARRTLEHHRDLLVGELEHRVKNSFANVLAIARMTFGANAEWHREFEDFCARIAALADANEMLVKERFESADMAETIAICLKPYLGSRDDQIIANGDRLRLQPRAALSISLAVHELCTNAVKYGALRRSSGRVALSWALDDQTSPSEFRFLWTETDGPEVEKPMRAGFGSKMIEQVLAAELGGTATIAYPQSGLTCRVVAPASNVVVTPVPSVLRVPENNATLLELQR